jgi:hypothetical protein
MRYPLLIDKLCLEFVKSFVHSKRRVVTVNHTHDYMDLEWIVTKDFGKEVIWHTVSIDGYTSIIGFNHEKQKGFVILGSSDIRDLSRNEIINRVLLYYI